MEKKRRWTEAEDAVLFRYVKEHGERDWNAIAKATGLDRCGKSCRLRWLDHLRPNLKKGPITPEEEQLIIQLQANMGNKWAKIATHLPGRTDNEIKNFWNGMKKKHKRVHSPLEPAPVLDPPSMATLQPYPCSQSQDNNIPLPEIVGGYFDLPVQSSLEMDDIDEMIMTFFNTVPDLASAPAPAPVPVPAPVLSPAISSDCSLEFDPSSLKFDPSDLDLEMDLETEGTMMIFLDSLPDDVEYIGAPFSPMI